MGDLDLLFLNRSRSLFDPHAGLYPSSEVVKNIKHIHFWIASFIIYYAIFSAMKFLASFLTIAIVMVSNINVGNIRTGESYGTNFRSSIITDIIDQLDANYNLAFVTTAPDTHVVDEVRSVHSALFTGSILDYDDFTRNTNQQFHQVHLQDNIPTLYIILQPTNKDLNELLDLLDEIK